MFYTIMNSLALLSLCFGIFFHIRSANSYGENAMGNALSTFIGYGAVIALLVVEGLVYGIDKVFN